MRQLGEIIDGPIIYKTIQKCKVKGIYNIDFIEGEYEMLELTDDDAVLFTENYILLVLFVSEKEFEVQMKAEGNKEIIQKILDSLEYVNDAI